MRGKLREAWKIKENEWVKWDHLKWHKVSMVYTEKDGYTHFRLEGKDQPDCNIYQTVELPWSEFKPPEL